MPDLEDVTLLSFDQVDAVLEKWVTDVAAKQHTEEDLAANREWLLQQEPGDENARLSEDVKRGGGIDFDDAYRAFNNGDHAQVEVFLETITPPPREMVGALERRINQALRPHTPAPARPAPVRRAVGHVARRPRERRAASRARARAPSSDDGPEPPPALAGKHELICAACGVAFRATRPDARTCSGRCRKQRHDQARRRDDDLTRLADLARGLVRSGEITGDDALVLVLWPTPDVLAALKTRELVAA